MKRVVIVFTLIVFITRLYGQTDTAINRVANNFTAQLIVFPHEKIYLHTDKPYYITGEKIYFRAFLLDAFSNKTSLLSRYIYVELINPVDSVVKRIKIKPDDDNIFHGVIPLPEDLPQGNYLIRAYTQYMYNQGESSFFSKYVNISDPQILSLQTESDFQFTEEGKVNASIRFVDAKTQEVIKPQSVSLRLNQDRTFTSRPDKDGWIRNKLTLPADATKRILYIELTYDNRVFKHYLRIPYPEGDFDVSFYPEGGHLIAGQTSNVAFKAINSSGAAINVEGDIVDSKNNIVAELRTFHEGMGEFYFNSNLNEHYQAVCRYGNRTLRFDLPEVKTDAYSLKTIFRDNNVILTVNKYSLAPSPELYLLIHSGGSVLFANVWDFSKEYIVLDKSIFPSGISHTLLFTKDFQIISERLFFFLNNDNGIAELETQKDSYKKREQVQTKIQLKDGEQQPLVGNFSIAVTNDIEVAIDTTSSILSGILLRSELRGNIENPEYYFQKGNKDAESAADLLMKTNGWTRYAIPDVIRGDLSYPSTPFEISQEISGIVKSGLLSTPAKNLKVSLISLDPFFIDMTETDDNGSYLFKNFEFPDSTNYFIQALNNKGKGKQNAELFIKEDTFPEIHAKWIEPAIQEENINTLLLDYVAKADMHYTYENGMRVINLPEVQIRARREENNKYKSVLYSDPDYSISSEAIKKRGAIFVSDLLYHVPGVRVSDSSISIRGGGDPLIIIDGVPFVPGMGESAGNILKMINVSDIGQMDVLKNIENTAIYGIRGVNGVIVIYTKRGESFIPPSSLFINHIIPLGYQLPVEFYSPKYDSPESINDPKPDLRTTIYWKPNVITDDNGNVNLDFYTADDPATYSVIIEGLSDDGKLIHYRGKGIISVK